MYTSGTATALPKRSNPKRRSFHATSCASRDFAIDKRRMSVAASERKKINKSSRASSSPKGRKVRGTLRIKKRNSKRRKDSDNSGGEDDELDSDRKTSKPELPDLPISALKDNPPDFKTAKQLTPKRNSSRGLVIGGRMFSSVQSTNNLNIHATLTQRNMPKQKSYQESRRKSSSVSCYTNRPNVNAIIDLPTPLGSTPNFNKSRKATAVREKEKKTRAIALKELIETEKSYVEDLHIIVEVYVEPLSTDRSDLIEPGDLMKLFSNIKSLIHLNTELLNKFEETEPENLMVGKIFLDTLQYFKMYTAFCSNQPIALATLSQLKLHNQDFQDFLDGG